MNRSTFPELMGSYKLSEKIIKHILSRHYEGSDGTVYDSISNNEILTLLYFSHISDISGTIEEFKISELAEVIGCSRRGAYFVIRNLVNKGFISISDSAWNGVRTITVLDNDFSNADYTNARYLNTNFSYFNYMSKDYEAFKKLSLYAKKTLLLILFNYQFKYGYRVSMEKLMDYINICKKQRVVGHIEELKKMFNENHFNIYGSKRDRLKYHNLSVISQSGALTHYSGISYRQTCYYKKKLSNIFRQSGIRYETMSDEDIDVKENHLQVLYSTTIHYLDEGLTLPVIENSIVETVLSHRVLNESAISRIYKILQDEVELKDCG